MHYREVAKKIARNSLQIYQSGNCNRRRSADGVNFVLRRYKVHGSSKHKALPGKREDVRRVWEKHLRPGIAGNAASEAYFYCYDDNDPDMICVFQMLPGSKRRAGLREATLVCGLRGRGHAASHGPIGIRVRHSAPDQGRALI